MRPSTIRSAMGTGLLACALIAAAITGGLRLQPELVLAPFPPGSMLDYEASFRSSVPPLREGFVREVLGGGAGSSGTIAPRRAIPSPGASFAADPYYLNRVDDVHGFVNDDLAEARVIERIPFTARTDSRTATQEEGEPTDCVTRGGTAWYRFEASSTEELIANSFGTDHPVGLGVYRRTESGGLELVAPCSEGLAGDALVQFHAEAGTTYLFQLADRATGGRLVFSLEPGGTNRLLSVTPSGEPSRWGSDYPSISADGRLIAFESWDERMAPRAASAPCMTRGALDGQGSIAYNHQALPCSIVVVADRSSGRRVLASVSSEGVPANGESDSAEISGDGRYVAFVSAANNLVRDTNGSADIFVHDLRDGATERVSVASGGRELQAPATMPDWDASLSWQPSISRDGRFVAFSSIAANVVPGDDNGAYDVFVHDRSSGRTVLASVAMSGAHADAASGAPQISDDGRYVVFASEAALSPLDDNDTSDVYVRDLRLGVTELVSRTRGGSTGGSGTEGSLNISADGRYVVFGSRSRDLVQGDTNGTTDIFVRDRVARRTVRVNVSTTGMQSDGPAYDPTISADGRYVAFSSVATTLVEGSRSLSDQLANQCAQQYLWAYCIEDIYVHDLVTRTTIRLPIAPSDGIEQPARLGALSADGSTLAYRSACMYMPGCGPAISQVWVHERPRRRG